MKVPSDFSDIEKKKEARGSQARVYFKERAEHPLFIFDLNGNYLTSSVDDVFKLSSLLSNRSE